MCSDSPEAHWTSSIAALALGVRLLAAALSPLVAPILAEASDRELRVCADPNNLPFSDERGEGFENRIVQILAKDLDAKVTYVWWAQRRGFIRNTLNAGLCDLIPGTAAAVDMLRTTTPYYRSTYVFVTRQDGPDISSLDDPRLRDLGIGVQLIGDDGANSPPVAALARRGIVGRLRGYSVYGDYSTPNPPARIIEGVARGEIDIAIAWGPLAGYFAARQTVPLRVTPVLPQVDLPMTPMIYDIALGVRRSDKGFRDELNQALARHRAEIDAVLAEYHVPRVDTRARSQ